MTTAAVSSAGQMGASGAVYGLHRTSQLRMLAVLSIVLLPHLLRMPVWAVLLVCSVVAWRTGTALRGWAMPGRWIRAALAIGAFVGVSISYGTFNGQHAGVCLLVCMAALKLTETVRHRDYVMIVYLLYFMLITHFLFSQAIGMIVYLLGCATLITALLLELSHRQGPLQARQALTTSARMIAQAVPLMLVLFVLFPRIPGPIWGIPDDAGSRGVTGLGETMSPGDISSLSQSGEVAFRVRFDGEVPPRAALYWRGPVLDSFDGRTWRTLQRGRVPRPRVVVSGQPVGYEMIVEPHRQRWLLALEVPDVAPSGTSINYLHQLLARDKVRDQELYRAQAWPQYVLEPELSNFGRRINLSIPRGSNPRTQALGAQWARELGAGGDPAQVIDWALARFAEQPFAYTLQPPLLGDNTVDEFMFDTRRGFCEHYANAFTFLMRAAGLPARVVTGYQGGTKSPNGSYWIVRQSDAHAWSEVWLAGRGWVRVDPTAAVAPDRINQGLDFALPDGEPVPRMARLSGDWIRDLQLRWDAIGAGWDRWVLAYGPELQQEFLSRFGIGRWHQMVLALTLVIIGLLSAIGLWMLWQARPQQRADRPRQLWNAAMRKLARRGIHARPSEGPEDFIQRACREQPDRMKSLQALRDAYLATRYYDNTDSTDQLAQAVKAL